MIEVVPIRDCVGCHTCESVCRAEAIQLIMNKEGFLYPLLDDTKCTQCKACLASPGVFARYIGELEKKQLDTIISFKFRAKPHGWRGFFIDI